MHIFQLFVSCFLTTFTLAGSLNNATNNGIGSLPYQRHYITSDQAQSIILAAVTTAVSLDVAENVAIVDPSGLLVGFLRMDNAFPGGVDLATKKAKTVVLFNGLTSTQLYPAVGYPNGTLHGLETTNGGLVVFPGGLPLYQNGYLLGAIGASGGTTDQDVQIAQAGLNWLTSSEILS